MPASRSYDRAQGADLENNQLRPQQQQQRAEAPRRAAGKLDAAIQAGASLDSAGTDDYDQEPRDERHDARRAAGDETRDSPASNEEAGRLDNAHLSRRRRRSISLDAFFSSSIVRELNGERVIISRGWPPSIMRPEGEQRRHHHCQRHGRRRQRPRHPHAGHRSRSERRQSAGRSSPMLTNGRASATGRQLAPAGAAGRAPISEQQKRRLLIEYLEQQARDAAREPGASPERGPSSRRPAAGLMVHYDLPAHPARLPIALAEGRAAALK